MFNITFVFSFSCRTACKGMVSRSGASDFVARQSHQNWFRNLRFLKTSLRSIVAALISLGACLSTIPALAPRVTRCNGAHRKSLRFNNSAYCNFSPDGAGVESVRAVPSVRKPQYPQGARRIRKAAKPLTAARRGSPRGGYLRSCCP